MESNSPLDDQPSSTTFDNSSGCAGLVSLSLRYYHRYYRSVMHTETNTPHPGLGRSVALEAVDQCLAYAARWHPRVGVAWYSLTDQMAWDTQLAEENGRVNACGQPPTASSFGSSATSPPWRTARYSSSPAGLPRRKQMLETLASHAERTAGLESRMTQREALMPERTLQDLAFPRLTDEQIAIIAKTAKLKRCEEGQSSLQGWRYRNEVLRGQVGPSGDSRSYQRSATHRHHPPAPASSPAISRI